jgi:DnaJ-class molecular chaperone
MTHSPPEVPEPADLAADVGTDRAADAHRRASDAPEGPRCPVCQGRGFNWDDDDLSHFYYICQTCDGSGTAARQIGPE